VSRHWQIAPLLLKGLSFVAIFFAVYFVLNLAGWLLHRSEKLLFLKTLNRTGGVALGLGKGTALAAMGIFLLTSTALLPQPTRANVESSYLAGPLTRLGQDLIRFGKEKVFAGDELEPKTSAGSTRL
jgi:uncharacterized membrane protein required for colicin V production